MTDMSRRSLLAIAPIASVAFAFPSAALPQTPEREPLMIEWSALSPTTQSFVLLDYWKALSIYQQRIACDRLRDEQLGHIADELMPEFTGPGIYEFRVLDDDGERTKVCPVAFLDRAPGRKGWFRWQHWHQGSFEGRGHLLPERRIRIIRKMEALG